MERSVSFYVTDYNPDGDLYSNDLVPHIDPISEPSSSIHQNPETNSPEDTTEYVIVTLDIHEDSVSIYSVVPARDGGFSPEENQEPVLEKRNGPKKKKKSTVKHRDACQPSRMNFDSSETLKGLKMFIRMTDSSWISVENRFDKITAKTNGLLLRSRFGECIGINSKEFALELFDAFARRWRYVKCERISKCELRDLWEQINDQTFDSRLKMFFDMADKDGDCRLTKDEVKEFIRLTTSANNQSITEKLANEYTELIMEELDIDDHGYIIMEYLEMLLLDVEALSEIETIEVTKKPPKKWYKAFGDVSSSSLIPCLKKNTSTKKT
ncbi:unnamed protein product [Cochlearia groenlandica]